MSLADIIDPLDKPIYGARDIAECVNLRKKKGPKKGQPDERMAFHYLATGALDAEKMGKGKKTTWWSTPRRLLKIPRVGA